MKFTKLFSTHGHSPFMLVIFLFAIAGCATSNTPPANTDEYINVSFHDWKSCDFGTYGYPFQIFNQFLHDNDKTLLVTDENGNKVHIESWGIGECNSPYTDRYVKVVGVLHIIKGNSSDGSRPIAFNLLPLNSSSLEMPASAGRGVHCVAPAIMRGTISDFRDLDCVRVYGKAEGVVWGGRTLDGVYNRHQYIFVDVTKIEKAQP